MNDRILESFLERQREEGLALAQSSDLLELVPLGGRTPERYIASFRCKGLVRTEAGEVLEAERFDLGILFPREYLRRAETFQVLTWFAPQEVFHPNISRTGPYICIGRLAPGTPLVDILYQCFEIITYNKVTMVEHDALNRDACVWARNNRHRFPVDRRALKRRVLDVQVEGDAR